MRTSRLSRRAALIAGGLGALSLAGPGWTAAGSGARRLTLFRAGDEVGEKVVSVRSDGAAVDVDIRIDIAVRVLGVTAYRYALTSSERWAGGRLQSLRARTDDNGTAHFARADADGDRLRVSGSAFEGTVGGLPGTTTYWSPAFLEREVWISTQDGRPLRPRPSNLGQAAFPPAGAGAQATRWRVGGDLEDLFLYYDAAGEWIGSEFPARGETARFVATPGPALAPLWVGA